MIEVISTCFGETGPGALRGFAYGLSGACWRLEKGFSPGKVKEPLVKSLLIESRVYPNRFGSGKTFSCGDDVLIYGSINSQNNYIFPGSFSWAKRIKIRNRRNFADASNCIRKNKKVCQFVYQKTHLHKWLVDFCYQNKNAISLNCDSQFITLITIKV